MTLTFFQVEKLMAWKQIKSGQQVTKSKPVIAKQENMDADDKDLGRDKYPDLDMDLGTDERTKDDLLKAGKALESLHP